MTYDLATLRFHGSTAIASAVRMRNIGPHPRFTESDFSGSSNDQNTMKSLKGIALQSYLSDSSPCALATTHTGHLAIYEHLSSQGFVLYSPSSCYTFPSALFRYVHKCDCQRSLPWFEVSLHHFPSPDVCPVYFSLHLPYPTHYWKLDERRSLALFSLYPQPLAPRRCPFSE